MTSDSSRLRTFATAVDDMGKPYDIPAFAQHLNDLSESGRGPVLQKKGSTRRFRYRFINPLLQPYVIMKGCPKS